MDKVKVFLADWQVLFREGIHFTLSGEEDFEVVGEATNNEEALDFIEKNPPEVAILNANRGKPSGVDITRRIKLNMPSIAIILIVDDYNEEQLFTALKSGASACLSKDMEPDELLRVIRRVVQGEYPISQGLLEPEIASRAISEFEASTQLNEEVGNLLALLLPVEAQILHYIANGNLLEEISRDLGIAEEAVRKQMDIILGKLVANDHSREVIDVVRSNLTSMISKISRTTGTDIQAGNYVTKKEFDAFKESLTERFETSTGEKDQK
ncbi:response regulator [Chloroflexota bacterium]